MKKSAPQLIKEELDAVLAALIEVGIADDQNFPALRRLSASAFEVSFAGAEHLALAMDDVGYDQLYDEIVSRRSYSVRFIDGGVIQLSYFFENDLLVKHRLAFYPSPVLRSFRECPEEYIVDQMFLEIVSRKIVPFPLRFDYDPKSAQDVFHPSCHITLGDVLGCRIPVSKPLGPRTFFDFVLRNFYTTEGNDFITILPVSRHVFGDSITVGERQIVHVVVP